MSLFKTRNKATARCSLTVYIAIAFKVAKNVNTYIEQTKPWFKLEKT
jgi:hypothetical protein